MSLLAGNRWLSKKTLAALAVTVAALVLVLRKVNVTKLAETLRHTHPGWFLAAVLAFGLALAFAAARWHLMLRLTGGAVRPAVSVRVYYIGQFLGFVLFGPAVGDVAKSALYARWHGAPLPQVIAAAPLDRLLGLAGLVLFAIPALALAAAKGVLGNGSSFMVPLPLLITGAVAGGLGLVLVYKWRPKSESMPARIFNSFAHSFTRLLASPRIALPGLALGFMVQALSCAIFALCLKAVVSVPCPWSEMLWTFPVISAMTSVPSVGGLGVREGASVALLHLYHVPDTDAVAASLLMLGVNFFWAVAGGILLWREEKKFGQRAG